MQRGIVYLIGAGPGDPKLITIRGKEAIERADVVVYDRLANPRLLRHMKAGAESIFVGKLPDKHILKQNEINQLLVDLALQGKSVARLKGGDPSVFGRVGEEAELLAEHGIQFEIIPGITSAIAVPIYAGIPVTHRDFTSSFAVITGHEYPNKTYGQVEWEKVATAVGTLVFLMGVANLETICERLIHFGKSPCTPTAFIYKGTWMEQKTIVGTLETIVDQVRKAGLGSPAIIIVGEVVGLRERITWFDKRPLFGKRVLVTRAREQASELVRGIEELGGEAIEFPVIRCQQPSNQEVLDKLDQAISTLNQFNWIVFTSVNGVNYFFRRMMENGVDIRSLSGVQIAAVGPKTQEALQQRGLTTLSLPAQYQAEGLIEQLVKYVEPGQSVLIPSGDLARTVLQDKLRELGVLVTKVEPYENVLSTEFGDEALTLLREGSIHGVTFTSSSTVTNLLTALRELGEEQPEALISRTEVTCIGPITAQTAQAAGLQVQRIAKESTVAAMIESLKQTL